MKIFLLLVLATFSSLVFSGNSKSVEPSTIIPADETVPKVICPQGGDLYFQVGNQRVRVKPDRWKVSFNVGDDPQNFSDEALIACQNAPLHVFRLMVMGPRELESRSNYQVISFLDTKSKQMHFFRKDFLPNEPSCKRGAHWTWCGSPEIMKDNEPAVSPWVSLKFDKDFYSTPSGETYFVFNNGVSGLPSGIKTIYKWDESLAVSYFLDGCFKDEIDKRLNCDPLNYIQSDRKNRALVESLLEKPKKILKIN